MSRVVEHSDGGVRIATCYDCGAEAIAPIGSPCELRHADDCPSAPLA